MERLERLYSSPLSYEEKLREREKVFSGALEQFGSLRERLKTNRYGKFGNTGMNNAYLLSLALYHRNFPLMESFLQSRGGSIREMISALRRLEAGGGDVLEKMRSELAQKQGGFSGASAVN
jgi:predicted aminopeptidase